MRGQFRTLDPNAAFQPRAFAAAVPGRWHPWPVTLERSKSPSLDSPSLPPPIATVTAGGLAIGILTSFGQGALPSGITSLANSAGAWSLAAFLLCLGNPVPRRGLLLGLLALLSMLAGYMAATELRGFATGTSLWLFWGVAAIVVGPVLGVGAAWVRASDPRRIAAGAGAIAGILVGEGAYGLTVIADTTSPVYWTLQIIVGLGIVLAAVIRLRRTASIGLCAGVTAAVAVAFYVTYSSL